MRRSSQYFTLKYLVQCARYVGAHFETIAAFDVDRVATLYATDCHATNPACVYRVMVRTVRGKFTELKS